MKSNRIIIRYINKYKKTYILLFIMFTIGIFLGTFYINSLNEDKSNKLNENINSIVENIKNNDNNTSGNLSKSIFKNIKNISIIWIFGCTLIGGYLILIVIVYNGFRIGYTISSFIYVLGIQKGIILSLSLLLLQNIVYIPTMFFISESGIKVTKEVYKNKSNIKSQIIRHLIVLIISIMLGIVASFIEIYISTNILKKFKEIL